MELTPAHLRYLLAIYEVSQTHLDISSRSIAEKLGVTKPSVVRVMNLLMERGMIVKEYYGKIYLTDRGIFVAREVRKQLDEVLAHFPPVEAELTDEERLTAALALTAALPERVFTGRYDQLMDLAEVPRLWLTACQDSKRARLRPSLALFGCRISDEVALEAVEILGLTMPSR